MPSEYNGYTRCNIVKIFNMILFFSNSCILKTKLLKEMFYADFMYYKMVGASITGLEYAKLPFGPVPNDYSKIIEICCRENLIDYDITYKLDLEYHEIRAKKETDLSVFSEKELNILNKVKTFSYYFLSNSANNSSGLLYGFLLPFLISLIILFPSFKASDNSLLGVELYFFISVVTLALITLVKFFITIISFSNYNISIILYIKYILCAKNI